MCCNATLKTQHTYHLCNWDSKGIKESQKFRMYTVRSDGTYRQEEFEYQSNRTYLQIHLAPRVLEIDLVTIPIGYMAGLLCSFLSSHLSIWNRSTENSDVSIFFPEKSLNRTTVASSTDTYLDISFPMVNLPSKSTSPPGDQNSCRDIWGREEPD